MRYFFVVMMFLYAFIVLAQGIEIEDDLDFDDTSEPLELDRKPIQKKVPMQEPIEKPFECKCQCLTRGLVPKNDSYFGGFYNEDKCVCPCKVI